MATNRLYQRELYLKNAQGKVLLCPWEAGRRKVVLDATLFFPAGGGQSCDTGRLRAGEKVWKVLEVYQEGEEIIHVIDDPDEELREGMIVVMELD